MAVESENDQDDETEAQRSRRAHRRVQVRLGVDIVLGRDSTCIGYTENMSESGVLVKDFDGPQLKKGRLVGMNMRGVLSDANEGEAEQYLMRVVRHSGSELALRFVSELK